MHARLLRNTAALPQQLPSEIPYTPNLETSEHMLRRKTPNGTLAAGYDGSPVEWTKRPHAMKHIISQSSNAVANAVDAPKTMCALDPSPINDQSLESRAGKQLSLQSPGSDPITDSSQDNGMMCRPKSNHGWRNTVIPPAGLDSMLNQSSTYHHNYNIRGSQHIPTVLQPMWPPCLGPTSIHSPGPWGPYWPDGAFEPYRPAPLQDPRFQGHSSEQRFSHPAQTQPAVNRYGQWFQQHSDLQCSVTADEPFTSNIYNKRENEEVVSTSPPKDISTESTSALNSQTMSSSQNRIGMPLAYRNKPLSWQDQGISSLKEVHNSRDAVRNMMPVPSSNLCHSSTSPVYHAQFKERILVWAYRIYRNLLASIEQARRRSLSEQHLAGAQNHSTYVQPPRRPYPSWSNNQNHDTYVVEPATHSSSRSMMSNLTQAEGNLFRGRDDLSVDQELRSRPLATAASLASGGQSQQRWHLGAGSLRPHNVATQPSYVPSQLALDLHANSPSVAAVYAIDVLGRLCQESGLEWSDGMLLTGCLAYGLGDYMKAMKWYLKVLHRDPNNVEAMSNLAATLLALNRRDDAEHYWFRAVKLRPSYFEAVEHLIGLLHESHRGQEAVKVIEYVEHALRTHYGTKWKEHKEGRSGDGMSTARKNQSEIGNVMSLCNLSTSGYAIPLHDNGRMLALVHGKGNMLYQLGDNAGATQAFEDAILIGAGRRHLGIQGLIRNILNAFSGLSYPVVSNKHGLAGGDEPILLAPDKALETSHLVFPPHGRLPGLDRVPDGFSQRAAVSIVSNSLLSLAKIYQDGMSSSGATAMAPRATSGVQEILALYYLSLSLQPSPSTANNVGILLASVQQSTQSSLSARVKPLQPAAIPGVIPGSGIALALAYYDYGLKLDTRHAHLYTNLGSLFKDIGQLQAAIKMYEKAVECDGNFDIALANLANAVKDQGKVSDAIIYYKRAVAANPDFAEAVCGLANALNSVCSWNGRGGIHCPGSNRDRWHVDEDGELYDSKGSTAPSRGWIERVVAIVEKQLRDGEGWGRGVLHSIGINKIFQQLSVAHTADGETQMPFKTALEMWAGQSWEGARVVRLTERVTKVLVRQIYLHQHVTRTPVPSSYRLRPQLPAALAIPNAPTVLPFHTFTCPLSAKQIRKISQRNGLRVSCTTLRAPWLPIKVYDPPSPPDPYLNVGYISSDFNNHPLAHLMQSVFGLHDRKRVKAFCYATTLSDGSVHRQQIEKEAPVFYDASSWSIERLVNQVVVDGIHILVNLNGYTRGAKNEVFAARPAPIQMSFMGFAGTLGAEWCDYLLADEVAIPPRTLRSWRTNADLLDLIEDGNHDDDQEDWVYGENIIFTRDTFFCCDHRQSAPDSQDAQLSWSEEQRRRWKMRKELFPELPDDKIILGNFNQLYKVRTSHYFLEAY